MSFADDVVNAATMLQDSVVGQGKQLVGTFLSPEGQRLYFGQMSAVGDLLLLGGGDRLGDNNTFVFASPAAAQLMFKVEELGVEVDGKAEPRKIGFDLPGSDGPKIAVW
jgi:hypothetical protein